MLKPWIEISTSVGPEKFIPMKFYEIAVIKSAKIPGTKYVILQGSVILIVSDYGCLSL